MIVFKKKDELRMNLTKMDDESTWPEVTEEFVNFLQGCGYIVTGLEVGKYLVKQYTFQEKDENAKTKKRNKK